MLMLIVLFVFRKCCVDANGKKTKLGKRGWKMFYLTLRDLVLFCFKVNILFIQLFSEINCNLNSADSAVSLIQLIQPLSGSS